MKALQIDPVSRQLLEKLADNPPHALILVGAVGMGKYSLGKAWGKEVAKSDFALTEVIPDDKGTISIATMRELYGQLSSKQKGYHVVIIQDADCMGTEAQNAFLKLLEEPKSGVIFVLTTSQPQLLLPTVHSRAQQIMVRPLTNEAITTVAKHIKPQVDSTELAQILFVANGRPGVAARMLQDDAFASQQKQSMQFAKQLLQPTAYERLLIVPKLASDKQLTVLTLEALQRMLVLQVTKTNITKQLMQFTAMIEAINLCLEKIAQNGNVRVQLLRLFSDTLV